MSDWNKERATHKAQKIGQLDVRPVTGGKRKSRRWKVVGPFLSTGRQLTYYRGHDEKACSDWIDKQRRSYHMTRQDQSERAHEQHATETVRWVDKLTIVKPKENV